MKIISPSLLLVALTANLVAPGQDRQPFIRTDAPVIALTHVRVIDGTGAAAVEDQTIIISSGKIQSVGPAKTASVPANA